MRLEHVECELTTRMRAEELVRSGAGVVHNAVVQSQTAVTAYLKSKKLLPFGFARLILVYIGRACVPRGLTGPLSLAVPTPALPCLSPVPPLTHN